MPNSNYGQSIPLTVTGNGTAGSPDSNVVSVQGVASGTAVVVTGNLTNNLLSPSTNNVGVLPAQAMSGTSAGYSNGNLVLLTTDLSGALRVNIVSGSGGNAAASATGSAVPANADYIGFNSSGNLVGVSAANPLPVTIASGGGSNPAAGTINNGTVPASGSYTAFWNTNGNTNLVGTSATAPFPVLDLTKYADGYTVPNGFNLWQASGQGNLATSTTLVNTTFSMLVENGQTIIIGLNASPTGITDNLGNTYTKLVGLSGTELWYCIGANGGYLRVTATYSSSQTGSSPAMSVAVYSGITATDGSASASGNSTSPSSGNITTTNANDVIIGVITISPAGGITPGTNLTSRSALLGATGGVNPGLEFGLLEDRLVSSTGSYAATATITSGPWVAVAGAFKVSPQPIGTAILGKNSSGVLHTVAIDSSNNLNVNLPNALPTGTNQIGHVILDSGSTTVVTGTVAVTQSGNWSVRLQDGSGSAVNKGQTTMSGSLPVAIASDQSAIPVTQSGNWTVAPSTSTGAAPTFATVGVTSAQAVASNSSRKGLILINTSANTISFGFGSNAAVLNSGITLVGGGVYEMDAYNFTTQAINAIASAASSNLAIQEFN